MKRISLSNNSVSLAGEFAVLSKLALQGYDANMTLGNTKNVDILVSPPKGKMFRLEVKTTRRSLLARHGKHVGTYSWIMTDKHINTRNLYYCFVILEDENKHSRFFMLPAKVVLNYMRKAHKHWLASDKKHVDSPLRQFRIGMRKEKCKVKAPKMAKYEVWK